MLKSQMFVPALAGVCLAATFFPSRPAAAAAAIILEEDFSADPSGRGWQTYGDATLFSWDSNNRNLQVTWDSSKSNSYFCKPLGITLNRSNDFLLSFDLRLSDIAIGTTPDKPYTFELAIGLIDLASATNVNFVRGDAAGTKNLVEFDYFPDSGYGATIAPTIISSNGDFNDGGFTFPLALTTNDLYHVQMRFIAASQVLLTRMTKNGQPFSFIKPASLGQYFSDFNVDYLAVSSYSDAGQDPLYAGSILAHGTVDNLVFVSPPPLGEISGGFDGSTWRGVFQAATNWNYQLERTVDFVTWTAVSPLTAGIDGELSLVDPAPPAGSAFYRVRAQRP